MDFGSDPIRHGEGQRGVLPFFGAERHDSRFSEGDLFS
jgi:hypothetical protein